MRSHAALLSALALAAALAAPACSSTPGDAPYAGAAEEGETLEHRGERSGIEHLAEVAPGLYRGAQPEGDASFALLASLGVRTALSVDGARPDVEAAARHGIRYVHVPIEYSAVTRAQQVRIAKVARDLPGGLFVHCHHGKHRGPAACAVAWMALHGATAGEAVAEMERAGTDPRYAGLYRDVRGFRPVTAEELGALSDADLPPAARVPDLVEAMVALDGTFGRMQAVRKAGWKTPPTMPDVQPAHEARILAEGFREMARLEESKSRPGDYRRWLQEAEEAAWGMERALRASDTEAAGAALDRVGQSCKDCHAVYRNAARSW